MAASSDLLFAATNIKKILRGKVVLRNLSLSLSAGERVLLLGPNGAGKSTFLRICSGLSRANSGKVISRGKEVRPGSVDYVGHHLGIYGDLSVEENLTLTATVAGITFDLSEHLKRWGLLERRSYRVEELSKGLQARASLARAFLFSREAFFLDEPTASLDASGVELLCSELQRGAESRALVIATHDVARLKEFPTRVLLLVDGEIVEDSHLSGSKESVYERYARSNR